MVEVQNYSMSIAGKGVITPEQAPVVNPATGEVFASAPVCDLSLLDCALEAAAAAFLSWADTPIERRAAHLEEAASVLLANIGELARLLTLEQGKPLARARDEVMASAHWLLSVAKRTLPEIVNEETADRKSIARRVPFGVVAAIVPWNFPLLLSIWKIAPALLAGNAVVLKPSPFTPLTALRLGELLRGLFPPGLLTVVSGDESLGPLLVEHPLVDMIALTGSTRTGQAVLRSAAKDLKRVVLELGGNDAAIVLPDADIELAAARIFLSAFSNAGQVCVATKRVYVHEQVFAPFLAALSGQLAGVKIGPGLTEGVNMGPLQNRPQYEKVRGIIDRAGASSCELISSGLPSDLTEGLFVAPVLVKDPDWNSEVVVEEAFGPVLPVMRFSELDDVVSHVNAGSHGLGGSIWSRDLEAAGDIARRLRTGMVTLNEGAYLSPAVPFSGHRHSGMGIENGQEGLLSYTQPQTLTIRLT